MRIVLEYDGRIYLVSCLDLGSRKGVHLVRWYIILSCCLVAHPTCDLLEFTRFRELWPVSDVMGSAWQLDVTFKRVRQVNMENYVMKEPSPVRPWS